ncbi:TraB/GumN family protein [Dokdonella koreensis]|uniref:Pheromone shutdown-related protein TraB n=1 Tax=Dokdonella koreensis DS-123 TaxID=1300342 RepID=A0A160DUA0_9GAMM|nr:TraB/GumN family protein [Dokdonella koreensis]ANB17814.1 Pheromone shutdown-related protein TraB [Dokdonella koreensis DS-123]
MQRDGVEYVVLGTAHVSRASVEAVHAIVRSEAFDAIAVELCEPRLRSIKDPDALRNLDLFQVIRQRKVGLVAANLALGAFQRRIAEQFGIEPGAEMKAAIDEAEARGLPLWLIDREVAITLRRAIRSVGFVERMGLMAGLAGSLFSREEVEESEIEKLKQGDMLGSMFGEFAKESPPLYEALIAERDRYMTAHLREQAAQAPVRRVLVVVGAGHMAGIERELVGQNEPPQALQQRLAESPPPSPWPKVIGIAVFAAIALAIAVLFTRGAGFGTDALLVWVLCTGIGAALGAFAGGGHPLSALAAFIVAPLKPFRPGVPSGAASAAVEVWFHRPRVADFDSLRDDVVHWTGWWKNRVSRTLLVFMFTNIGMMFGTWVAGFRIFGKLI